MQQNSQRGCLEAFRTVFHLIRPDISLPENVFERSMRRFLFFESDALFFGSFVEAAQTFLEIERSSAVSLVNLTEALQLGRGGASPSICLTQDTTEDKYRERLRGGSPAQRWLYSMDRYGCASNVGEWCIYCEKRNDVAVIGLRDDSSERRFKPALALLGAAPLEELWAERFPFREMVKEWRDGLVAHYGGFA